MVVCLSHLVKRALLGDLVGCPAGGIPISSVRAWGWVYGTLSGLLAKFKVTQKRRRGVVFWREPCFEGISLPNEVENSVLSRPPPSITVGMLFLEGEYPVVMSQSSLKSILFALR